MQLQLEPVPGASRVEAVVERLRSQILTRAFVPGTRLPNERELADALGVNRGSVREALKRLEFLELIEVRHGQGSFVRELSASSALQLVEDLLRDRRTITSELLRQILEFRRHVTLHVVELAARHRTPEQVERGRELLGREHRAGTDAALALEVDVELNALLGEASGNLMYRLLTNLLTKWIRRLGPLYYNERRNHARSLETHRRLLEALEAADPAQARRVVEEILDYSEGAILAEMERLEAEGLIGPGARETGA